MALVTLQLFLLTTFLLTSQINCQKNAEPCPEQDLRQCYECSSTADGPCGDPFNLTSAVTLVKCQGPCAKWLQLQQPDIGPSYIIRTCGSNINIRRPLHRFSFVRNDESDVMVKYEVKDDVMNICLQARVDGKEAGQLCFCRNKEEEEDEDAVCNTAPSHTRITVYYVIAAILSLAAGCLRT